MQISTLEQKISSPPQDQLLPSTLLLKTQQIYVILQIKVCPTTAYEQV